MNKYLRGTFFGGYWPWTRTISHQFYSPVCIFVLFFFFFLLSLTLCSEKECFEYLQEYGFRAGAEAIMKWVPQFGTINLKNRVLKFPRKSKKTKKIKQI
jgi:hypothetical protein